MLWVLMLVHTAAEKAAEHEPLLLLQWCTTPPVLSPSNALKNAVTQPYTTHDIYSSLQIRSQIKPVKHSLCQCWQDEGPLG
jgi:hypothetical protein